MRFRFVITLLISLLTLAVWAQDETPIPIGVGTFTGEISESNTSDLYSIELLAGQQLSLSMLAADGSDLDAFLVLFDATGAVLASDDDSAGEHDARIVFNAPTTGLYLIEATRYETSRTVGAYVLTLSLSSNANDPLSVPPNFAVPFTIINYEAAHTGSLNAADRFAYYVIGSQQGDFVRIELNTTSGDLNADVQLFNQSLQSVSRLSQSNPSQKIIFAAIPQTGWYLIQVTLQSGSGSFSLLPSLVSDTLLTENTPVEARFDESTESLFFVLNAAINERIFVNLSIREGENILSTLRIEDINGTELDTSVSPGTQNRLSITIPRSGPYIVEVRNTGTGRRGLFSLQLRRTAVDVNKLDIDSAEYNQNYINFISPGNAIRYYRFSGKAGERVTIRMIADTGNQLDPYLILADAAFNELIFSDNVAASRNAQISQFRLPSDGDYYILASRAGLADRGTTVGSFTLEITVGEIKLETGLLTATLTWTGGADLNLFVRTPEGYTVSWANPTEPRGGLLQINSNTGCETLTDQPVEHIYWPDSRQAGDYTVWVWYQGSCTNLLPVNFELTITVDGEIILPRPGVAQTALVLQPSQRHESVIRINPNGSAVVVNDGTVSSPSPQLTASQGGDILITYGTIRTGAINDSVFAQFYQFNGTAGDRIRIRLERITGNLDPILFLRDSLDRPLPGGENDDISASDNNAQIDDYTLPETATYVIAVSRYGLRDGTTIGDYSLSLELLEAAE